MPSSIRGFVAAILIAAMIVLPIAAAPNAQETTASITQPFSGQQVDGLVDIIGSVSAPDLQRYEVAFASDPNPADPNPPPDGWVLFAQANIILNNAQIALWDAGSLAQGTYALRVQVFRSDGSIAAQAFVRGLVRGSPPPAEPEATPTGVPPAPTFEDESSAPAQPTVLIEQPPTATPEPTDESIDTTNTDAAAASTRPGVPTIDLSRFGSACISGMTCAIGGYFLLALFAGGRWSVRWIMKQAREREQHQSAYPRASYQEQPYEETYSEEPNQ